MRTQRSWPKYRVAHLRLPDGHRIQSRSVGGRGGLQRAPSLQAQKPGPACYSVTLRNTDTVQQTWCRLPDKSKCCTRQPLRRKKQWELQKQAGWPREQEVALLGRPPSGAPLPCLWHQPPRVCILCTLHSGTATGDLGEAEGPKRQMERGHTEDGQAAQERGGRCCRGCGSNSSKR